MTAVAFGASSDNESDKPPTEPAGTMPKPTERALLAEVATVRMWAPTVAGLSKPGMETSTRSLSPMAIGDGTTRRLPVVPTSEKHILAVVLDTLVLMSVTVIVPPHSGGGGKVPVGASTFMVPVLTASAPVAEVVKSNV